MKKFIITIDSACDGNKNELFKKDVDVIYYHYSDGQTEYLDEMSESQGKSFFNNIRKGTKYSTSQLNQYAYYNFFKDLTNKNKNIIHISLTEGLSSSINQAIIAARRIKEEDPSTNIQIIDSLIACNGELVLLDEALRLQKEKLDVEEAASKLREYAAEINTYFTTDTLTYFVRGGRLPKAVGFIGNMLKINPVLICAPNGNLKIDKPMRGKKAAYNYVLQETKARVTDADKQCVYICHADNLEGANEMKDLLLEGVGFKEAKIYPMGPIIGSHTGPGLIAVFYHGKKRGEKIK